MRNRIGLVVILAATTIIIMVSVVRARLTAGSWPSVSPVDALDRCVQSRFRTDGEFGLARMPVVPQHVYQFAAETPEEKAAVDALRRQRLTAGFYLAGRGLLTRTLSKEEWQAAGEHSDLRAISQPLAITPGTDPGVFPAPWDLQELARQGLVASETDAKYQATLGRWRIDVLPIRASKRSCLDCHAGAPGLMKSADTRLKIGDALGVAVYVYSRTPDETDRARR